MSFAELRERFESATSSVTCELAWTAEVVPMHRSDFPGAPVTAWRVRYHWHGVGTPHGAFGLGARHENRESAEAELNVFNEWLRGGRRE